MALAAAGVVSLGSVTWADEAPQRQVLTALSSTTLSGYVDTSAVWKPGTDQGGTRLPGHVFDGADKMDGFNLDAVKLSLGKPLDEGQWAAGYNVDLIFGSNANFYQAVPNLGTGPSNNGVNTSNFAIKNAYVDLRAPIGNGLDIKVGVFDTIIGYEVFDSVSNPNWSRSYGFALEPTQHTGVLLSYKFADWLSAAAGVADTTFGPINDRGSRAGVPAAESIKAYMGSVTITAPDSTGFLGGSVLYAGIVNGLNGATVFGTANTESEKTTSLYAGATIKLPITGLSAGVAYDYRTDFAAAGLPANTENKAYALAGYLSWAPKDSKFKINDRIDYTNADPGTWYAPGAPYNGGSSNTDNRQHLLSNTLTLDYSLWENVVTRGEFRWDHSLTGDQPYGGNDNPMKNAFILAANIIYKF
jgi:hypothetical protein